MTTQGTGARIRAASSWQRLLSQCFSAISFGILNALCRRASIVSPDAISQSRVKMEVLPS
jgi:hypothetical protein